ncbi:MAG: hybrid sensor histidine kinase/response regulator [Oleibacter sp.]|nr:hybrid sensor histidine kinase/response regulator [Thalassolituus sp.]
MNTLDNSVYPSTKNDLESIEHSIKEQATKDLYDRMHIVIWGTFILTTTIFFTLNSDIAKETKLYWYIFSILVMTYGVFLLIWYTKKATDYSIFFWRSNYMLGVICLGLIWGSAGLLFFDSTQPTKQLLLFSCIVGVTISGVSNSSVWLGSFLAFLLITNVPMTTMCFLEGSTEYTGLGASFTAYMFVAYMISKSSNKSYIKINELGIKNYQLAMNLQTQYQISHAANRAKTQFLASASHDLRQPVHSLALLIETLKSEAASDNAKDIISKMTTSVAAIDDLLVKLLDISKLDSGGIKIETSKFPLDPLITNIINECKPIAEKKGLIIENKNIEYYVESDMILLGNILRNFFTNAIKYTNKGSIKLTYEILKNDLIINISDTGIGIPESEFDNIFQEFVQLDNPERDRQKGLGLGLSICKRIADLLKHDLYMISSEGEGSVFSIVVPVVEQSHLSNGGSPALTNHIASLSGVRVLVIEDDSMVLSSTEKLLMSWGVSVKGATDIDTAINLTQDDPKWLDIIISDYRLAKNENGSQAIKMVCATAQRTIPGLIITGDTAPECLKELSESGFEVIHKPVKPAFLRNVLNKFVKNNLQQ